MSKIVAVRRARDFYRPLRRKRQSMIKLPCNKCNGCVSSSSHRLKSAGALIKERTTIAYALPVANTTLVYSGDPRIKRKAVTALDYRLKNSSCFYDYYINALSMPSKNGITPIKVTPSSFIHGCVLPSRITILRKESRILRSENVSCSIFSFVSTFNAD